MRWFRRKSAPAGIVSSGTVPNRAESLACRPVRNPAVRESANPGGGVRLTYPLAFKPWFESLTCRFVAEQQPPTKRIDLDEMGTFCWERIDGEYTVAQIAEAFVGRYSLHPREAERAVGEFLRTLGRRGIVAMRLPEA